MLNTNYMEFFYGETIPESEDLHFIKSFLTDDEEVLFFFFGLRDRLAFFTSKRLIFMYAPVTENPDKISRELDFVHYDKIFSYSVVTSKEYDNEKLEINLSGMGIIGFNFSNHNGLLKFFEFLSKEI